MVIQYAIDAVNLFRSFYHVEGWAHDGTVGVLPRLTFQNRSLPARIEQVHRSDLEALGAPPLCGFHLRYILCEEDAPQEFAIELRMPAEELRIENPGRYFLNYGLSAWRTAERAFFSRLWPGASILELGSRARSGTTRRGLFDGLQYTGLDIKAGENVDVVGDAHCLSSLFAPGQFDFAYSISAFEHFSWPWKVALELNTVLKTGGLALIQSHQTWPQHDAPSDFFRFSASAWRALFCDATGFQVVNVADDMPAHIVPAHFTGDPTFEFTREPAFLVSICVAEKIHEPRVNWDAIPDLYISGDYPT